MTSMHSTIHGQSRKGRNCSGTRALLSPSQTSDPSAPAAGLTGSMLAKRVTGTLNGTLKRGRTKSSSP